MSYLNKNNPFKEIEEKFSEIEKENAPLKAKIDLIKKELRNKFFFVLSY